MESTTTETVTETTTESLPPAATVVVIADSPPAHSESTTPHETLEIGTRIGALEATVAQLAAQLTATEQTAESAERVAEVAVEIAMTADSESNPAEAELVEVDLPEADTSGNALAPDAKSGGLLSWLFR